MADTDPDLDYIPISAPDWEDRLSEWLTRFSKVRDRLPRLRATTLDSLSVAEEAALRRAIKEEPTWTMPAGPRSWKRIPLIPVTVHELHGEKPLGTLRVLLDIVKHGAARDAIIAATSAVYLEDDPRWALRYLYSPVATFDALSNETGSSERQQAVIAVSELLSAAELRLAQK